jgi:hypothetical protein
MPRIEVGRPTRRRALRSWARAGVDPREGVEVGILLPAGTGFHVNGDEDCLDLGDRLPGFPEGEAESAFRVDAAPELEPGGLLRVAQGGEGTFAGELIRTRQGPSPPALARLEQQNRAASIIREARAARK